MNKANIEIKQPTIQEIATYLTNYGIKGFRQEKDPHGQDYIIVPFLLSNDEAVLVSFKIEGEFMMCSTVGLFTQVPLQYCKEFLQLNDTIKLVKLFITKTNDQQKTMSVDIGFELWAESWQEKTFFAFIDMIFYGCEKTLQFASDKQIPHKTEWIQFQEKEEK